MADTEAPRRPTEGAPTDAALQEMCDNANRVKRLCDVLGFEFRGHQPLIDHLQAHITHGPPGLFRPGQGDPLEVAEDPDLRAYIWDLVE